MASNKVKESAQDTWKDLKALGYSRDLALLNNAPPAKEPAKPTPEMMDALRSALADLKVSPESAAAHRKVGEALQALGREDAAKREFQTADDLEKSTVCELD